MTLTGTERCMHASSAPDGATLPFAAARLRLKPACAARDLALVDALAAPPGEDGARLTAMLAAAFEPVAEGADGGFARLSVVERQAALFRLAFAHGDWPAWFVMECPECGELIDLRAAPHEFACEEASSETLAVENRRFMRPNGHHEAAIAQGLPAEELAQALCLDPPLAPAEAKALAPRLVEALDADAGRLTTSLPLACPHCAAEARFWFDPIDWIGRHAGASLRDVHVIASAYGWAEAEILALPAVRRQAYLAMLGARP